MFTTAAIPAIHSPEPACDPSDCARCGRCRPDSFYFGEIRDAWIELFGGSDTFVTKTMMIEKLRRGLLRLLHEDGLLDL